MTVAISIISAGSSRAASRLAMKRAGNCADRPTEADDGEQTLALFRRVQVVRKRPELRDHHQAEDADPQIKEDADDRWVNAAARDEEEGDQRDDEERRD